METKKKIIAVLTIFLAIITLNIYTLNTNAEEPETTEPSGETTEPSGETTDPSGETTDSSGETTDPSGETTDPSGETTDGEDTEESCWEKEYSIPDTEYKFIINDVKVVVKEVNADEEKHEINYNEIETRSLKDSTGKKYTVDPEFKKTKFSKIKNGMIINTKLNFEPQDMQEIIKEYTSKEEYDDKMLFIDLVLDYKWTNIPEFKYKKNVNFFDTIIGLFTGPATGAVDKEITEGVNDIEENKNVQQVLNRATIIEKNSESNSPRTYYNNLIEEDSDNLAYVLNYALFTNDESQLMLRESADEEDDESLVFMFYSVENMEKAIEGMNKAAVQAENTVSDLIVSVPNTKVNATTILYVVSTVLIVFGIGLLIYGTKEFIKD